MESEIKRETRPYEKPALHIIDLAAEEVLGTACKTTTTAGPAFQYCIAGCTTQGS